MTSRTTPVGILVIALAGLFAVGCNAQTSAVFESLVDSSRAPASTSGGDTATGAADGSPSGNTWWPHPGGRYEMDLPPGWFGVGLDSSSSARLIDAVGTSNSRLADRLRSELSRTAWVVSGIAGDPSGDDAGPMLVVLVQAGRGRALHELKQQVKQQISQLPELSGALFLGDNGLPDVRGWRFGYSIEDPDLGALRVRSYLFLFGKDAYLVNFVAPEHSADDAESLFDAIAESLGFGV